MNIFSNIGVTELIFILLLALLVVGPERLPEMGRKLAKTLRDLRRAYEKLTSELGPELMSFQETTRELRESVESVRSIPKDMVDSMVKAADLEDTVSELKGMGGDLQKMGKDVAQVKQVVQHPLRAAADTARQVIAPPPVPAAGDGSDQAAVAADETGTEDLPALAAEDVPQEQSGD